MPKTNALSRSQRSHHRNPRTASSIILSILLGICIFLSVLHGVFFGTSWQVTSIGNAGNTKQEAIYSQVMGYLEGKGALPAEMTAAEKSHMADVRNVVVTGTQSEFALWIVFLIAGAAYYLFARKQRKTFFTMMRDAAFSVGGIIILLAIGALFFDQFFVLFHNVLFPQGNWLFPPTSMLISTFPESFFQEGLLRILEELVGCALVLYGGGLLGRHFAEKA